MRLAGIISLAIAIALWYAWLRVWGYKDSSDFDKEE